jgi:hypothetical protein
MAALHVVIAVKETYCTQYIAVPLIVCVCVCECEYVCVYQICMWVCGCVSNMHLYMFYHMAAVYVADAIPLAEARRQLGKQFSKVPLSIAKKKIAWQKKSQMSLLVDLSVSSAR